MKNEDGTKTCKKCGFRGDATTCFYGGLVCKTCVLADRRNKYAANKEMREKNIAYGKEYRKKVRKVYTISTVEQLHKQLEHELNKLKKLQRLENEVNMIDQEKLKDEKLEK